jgi:protein TonB
MSGRRSHLRVVPTEPASALPAAVAAAAAIQGPIDRLPLPVTAVESAGTFPVTILASLALHGVVLALAGWLLFGDIQGPVPLLDVVVVTGDIAASSGESAAQGAAPSLDQDLREAARPEIEPQVTATEPARPAPAEPMQPAAAPQSAAEHDTSEVVDLEPPTQVAAQPQPSTAAPQPPPLEAVVPAPQDPTVMREPAPDATLAKPPAQQAPPSDTRELRPPRPAAPAKPPAAPRRTATPTAPQAPAGEPAPSPPSAPAASIAPPGAGQSGSGDTGVRALGRVDPVYPNAARARGAHGRVLVSVLVGADGKVQAAEVQNSSGHADLDAEAVLAVRKWPFAPARRMGTAVPERVLVPVVFRLR